MLPNIFADDFVETPYWSAGIQPFEGGAGALPRNVDVLVVGSGMTGLAAAQRLASAGRSVLVLDASEPGGGASSRNAGMLGKGGRQPFLVLSKALGLEKTIDFFKELNAIYDESVARIREEGFECGFRVQGRFIGALAPERYTGIVREYEARAKYLGEEFELVPETSRPELGSDRYYGGVVVKDNAALNPAEYTRAMLVWAGKAGATIVGNARVTRLVPDGQGWRAVVHNQGDVRSRDVVIATNGYTDGLVPWLNRRLLPINAYMVATDVLADGLASQLMPNNRTYLDNTRAAKYFQLSPDGKRIVFGTKTGRWPSRSLKGLAREIHRDMTFLFPELANVKLSHAWTGRCAASWDFYPHLGVHEGIHYALGYCFGGLLFAPYFGRKIAERILRSGDDYTVYGGKGFPEVPLHARILRRYTTPIATRYYAHVDRPVIKE